MIPVSALIESECARLGSCVAIGDGRLPRFPLADPTFRARPLGNWTDRWRRQNQLRASRLPVFCAPSTHGCSGLSVAARSSAVQHGSRNFTICAFSLLTPRSDRPAMPLSMMPLVRRGRLLMGRSKIPVPAR